MTATTRPALTPFSSRRTLYAGDCPCECGGTIGYRPLFVWEGEHPTTIYRQDEKTGRPLARLAIICRHDTAAVFADLDYRAAEGAWRSDRKQSRPPLTMEPE